jgi:hypothetical protein
VAPLIRDPVPVRPVAIESATALSPEVTGIDQLAEQRRRRESRLVQSFVQDAANIEVGVEAYEVGQL